MELLQIWEVIIYRDWGTTRTEYVNSRWWTFEDAEERADALTERGECPNIVERSLLNLLRHGGPCLNRLPKGKPPSNASPQSGPHGEWTAGVGRAEKWIAEHGD